MIFRQPYTSLHINFVNAGMVGSFKRRGKIFAALHLIRSGAMAHAAYLFLSVGGDFSERRLIVPVYQRIASYIYEPCFLYR